MFFIELLILFLASAAISAWLARQEHLIDIPNERSSHETPTPRGGGLAIVLVFFASLVVLLVSGWLDMTTALAFLGGGGAMAVAGYMDDHNHLDTPVRLGVHLGAALWGVWWLWVAPEYGHIPAVPLGSYMLNWGWAGFALAVIAAAWLANLTNFMDGIDGMAAMQTLFLSLAGALMALLAGAWCHAMLMAALAAATAGFLVYNWPPAALFMGDVGSGFLGLVSGLLAVLSAETIGLWPWAVLMSLFVADTAVALVQRRRRGLNLAQAHRSHAYQRLARRWNSHGKVTTAAAAVNILFLLPLALWAYATPQWGWLACLLAWSASFYTVWRLGSGRDDT
jgi:Fuc2NAc and GlcNAc transferase